MRIIDGLDQCCAQEALVHFEELEELRARDPPRDTPNTFAPIAKISFPEM